MEDTAKIEMPNFIHTTCIMSLKEGGNAVKLPVRINPYHITSYYGASYIDDDKEMLCTIIYCGGKSYTIDMKIEEVDEMLEDVDKSISIK